MKKLLIKVVCIIIVFIVPISIIIRSNTTVLAKTDVKVIGTIAKNQIEEEVEEDSDPDVNEPINTSPRLYEPYDFQVLGIVYWEGWNWTWYSEQVLPGYGLDIPGRYVDEDGYICDENGYICLASNVLEPHTVIDTPFGKQGKVYDCGCDADIIDVYVSW